MSRPANRRYLGFRRRPGGGCYVADHEHAVNAARALGVMVERYFGVEYLTISAEQWERVSDRLIDAGYDVGVVEE